MRSERRANSSDTSRLCEKIFTDDERGKIGIEELTTSRPYNNEAGWIVWSKDAKIYMQLGAGSNITTITWCQLSAIAVPVK